MSLLNIQYSFMAHLAESKQIGDEFISELSSIGRLSAEKQLSIYRHNVSGAHQKVLAQVYPACFNILGEDYFNQLCFSYRFEQPSTNPDLNFYGKEFPSFIARQLEINNELEGFEYLVDLTVLEWHWHTSYFAKDDSVFDFEKLALVSSENQESICFTLSHSFSLHLTEYPLFEIWSANKDNIDEKQEFAMPDSENYFCISRVDFSPMFEPLNYKQYKLLHLISCGVSLVQLSELDIQNELMNFIAKGWVTGFSLHN